MATTRKASAVKSATVKSVPVTVEVEVTEKPTANDRLLGVLTLIEKQAANPTAEVKWGKAVPLVGGGAVYVNRGNADVRLTTGAVAALAKTIPGATIRGPQSNYLRIPFTK